MRCSVPFTTKESLRTDFHFTFRSSSSKFSPCTVPVLVVVSSYAVVFGEGFEVNTTPLKATAWEAISTSDYLQVHSFYQLLCIRNHTSTHNLDL